MDTPKIVKVTPVKGQGDDVAMYWYNAVMATNRDSKFYNLLRDHVNKAVRDLEECNELMNAAIDAALYVCDYSYYTQGAVVRAFALFDSHGEKLSAALDRYLDEFIKWGSM
jgi:hypothetical protein